MSTLTPTPADTFVWPADVLDFAVRHGLEPLRQAGLRLFPTGRLKVWLDTDHEVPDWQTIFFEMFVPLADATDWKGLHEAWLAELRRLYLPLSASHICPAIRRVKG
jgi:hypothetical protein